MEGNAAILSMAAAAAKHLVYRTVEVLLQIPHSLRDERGIDKYRLDLAWPGLVGFTVAGLTLDRARLVSLAIRIGRDEYQLTPDLLLAISRLFQPVDDKTVWKSLDVWDAFLFHPVELRSRPLTVLVDAVPERDRPAEVRLKTKLMFGKYDPLLSLCGFGNPIKWSSGVRLRPDESVDLGVFQGTVRFVMEANVIESDDEEQIEAKRKEPTVRLTIEPEGVALAEVKPNQVKTLTLVGHTHLRAVVPSKVNGGMLYVGTYVPREAGGYEKQ